MNSVSWFIYLVDIIGKAEHFFQVSLFLVGMWIVLKCLFSATFFMNGFGDDQKAAAQMFKSKPKYIIFLVLSIVTIFIPSKQAIYLIAGSEMGEEIVKTEEAKKIRSLVNKQIHIWSEKLDKQIVEDQIKELEKNVE
jgi:hypothetical protein